MGEVWESKISGYWFFFLLVVSYIMPYHLQRGTVLLLFQLLTTFYYFFLLNCSGWLPVLFNKSGGSRHPCLVLISTGKAFSLSPLSTMLAAGFWSFIRLHILYYVELCLIYTPIVFIIDVEFCQMLFFCTYWDDHMIFIFHVVNVVYHINWFVDVEQSSRFWNKSHLIMVYTLNVLYSVC